jgi:hypothetical protein
MISPGAAAVRYSPFVPIPQTITQKLRNGRRQRAPIQIGKARLFDF